MTIVRTLRWKTLTSVLLLFLACSTCAAASDASVSTGSSESCDSSNDSDSCRNPEQLASDTKPACPVDVIDEDEEYCLQQASVGKCSVAGEESEILKKRCPKACRTCWSCDNVGGEQACKAWADSGECRKNPRYMLVYCAKACNICHFKGDLEELMRQRLEEKLKQEEMEQALQKTKYGLEQTITDDASQETYDKMIEYMENTVMVDPKYESVRQECKLRSENCVFWASIGECEKTRAYMVVQCAPACQTCEQLDLKQRCPYDPDEPTALQPGDLNRLFERIVQLKEYSPSILSQPGVASEFVDDGPWVVTLDNFLSDAECDRLIELGGTQGYIESADVGEKLWDGTYSKKLSTSRTSSNAWCQGDCELDPVTQAVTKRMEDLTGIPSANFEYLQLLQYEIGQYYKQHHDYIDYQQERKQGVRTLTIFLYLNTVEAGGGTNFPLLNNMTVMPKRGRALIWPSVLDENPNVRDPRTDHQALPVEKGVKFGANAWIHQRDFKEPFERACI
ncbi:procollagen-proline 4-dioxygenase [Fragilaria crotonensis]|nr:procollagen-proline 4-dioxygenase [Fragilaria crotonensis]